MRTIEITRMEDVRVGDDITLTRAGVAVSGRVQSEGTTLGHTQWHIYFRSIGTLYAREGWTLVSATREVPEWEPGTAGTATVRGVKGVEVVRSLSANGEAWWFTPIPPATPFGRTGHWHPDDQVTDFVPDDASRWAAQAKLVEIDLDNARAEAERWKAEAEMLTAKVDRLMPLQEHENECAYRQRTEKAEAEVERLRANSALPSYSEIEEAISGAFEQGIGLTFEGGIPQAVIGRVMAAIIAARGEGK